MAIVNKFILQGESKQLLGELKKAENAYAQHLETIKKTTSAINQNEDKQIEATKKITALKKELISQIALEKKAREDLSKVNFSEKSGTTTPSTLSTTSSVVLNSQLKAQQENLENLKLEKRELRLTKNQLAEKNAVHRDEIALIKEKTKAKNKEVEDWVKGTEKELQEEKKLDRAMDNISKKTDARNTKEKVASIQKQLQLEKEQKTLKDTLLVYSKAEQVERKYEALRADAREAYSKGIITKDQLRDSTKNLTKAQKVETQAVNDGTNALVRKIRQMESSIVGLYAIKKAYEFTLGRGHEFNKLIETETVGLKLLIAQNLKNVDVHGRSVTALEKFTYAQKEATKAIKIAREINVQTPHTLGETLQILKLVTPQVLKLGGSLEDVGNITKNVSVVGASMGIEFQQLLKTVDSLMSGQMQESGLKRAMEQFGITQKEVNKTIEDGGDVVKLFIEKLKQVDPATIAIAQTWKGATAQFINQWDELWGELQKPMFDAFKEQLVDTASFLKDNKESIMETTDTMGSLIGVAFKAGVAYVALNTALKAYTAWQTGAAATATASQIAQLGSLQGVIAATATAQGRLNLLMRATPWGMAITGAVLLAEAMGTMWEAEERRARLMDDFNKKLKSGLYVANEFGQLESASTSRQKIYTEELKKQKIIRESISAITDNDKIKDGFKQKSISKLNVDLENSVMKTKALKEAYSELSINSLPSGKSGDIGYKDNTNESLLKSITKYNEDQLPKTIKLKKEISKIEKEIVILEKLKSKSLNESEQAKYSKDILTLKNGIANKNKEILDLSNKGGEAGVSNANKVAKAKKDLIKELEKEQKLAYDLSSQKIKIASLDYQLLNGEENKLKVLQEELALLHTQDALKKTTKDSNAHIIALKTKELAIQKEIKNELKRAYSLEEQKIKIASLDYQLLNKKEDKLGVLKKELQLLRTIDAIKKSEKETNSHIINIKSKELAIQKEIENNNKKIVEDEKKRREKELEHSQKVIEKSNKKYDAQKEYLSLIGEDKLLQQLEDKELLVKLSPHLSKEETIKLEKQLADAFKTPDFKDGVADAFDFNKNANLKNAISEIGYSIGYSFKNMADGIFSNIENGMSVSESTTASINEALGNSYDEMKNSANPYVAATGYAVDFIEAFATDIKVLDVNTHEDNRAIADSIDILNDTMYPHLEYTQKMSIHLENMDRNFNSMASNILYGATDIAGTEFVGTESGFGDKLGLGDDFVSGLLNGIGNAIYGKKVSLENAGIHLAEQSVESMMDGVSVSTYQHTRTTKKVLGVKVSDKTSTNFGDVSSQMQSDFDAIMQDGYDSILESASLLNIEEAKDRLDNISIKEEFLDFKDKTEEEIKDILQGEVSNRFSLMVKGTMSGTLDGFRVTGEEYYQTLVRSAVGYEQASESLRRLNIKTVEFKDIQNQQGDVGTETVRDSLLNTQGREQITSNIHLDWLTNGFQEVLNYSDAKMLEIVSKYDIIKTDDSALTGIGNIVKSFSGTSSELISLYLNLDNFQFQLQQIGLSTDQVTQTMINGAGSMSELAKGQEDYISNYFTDAEQSSIKMAELNKQFESINVSMPNSNDEFRTMVENIDLTTESGQALYGSLMTLSGEFHTVQESIEAVIDTLTQVKLDEIESFSDWKNQLEMSADQKKSYSLMMAGREVNQAENVLGVSGVNVDTYTSMFDAMVTDETLEDWKKLGDEIQNLTNLQQVKFDEEVKQVEEINTYIEESLSGSLSYLSSIEKLPLAKQAFMESSSTEDATAYLTLAKAQSVSREDYALDYNRTMQGLEKEQTTPIFAQDGSMLMSSPATEQKIEDLNLKIENLANIVNTNSSSKINGIKEIIVELKNSIKAIENGLEKVENATLRAGYQTA